MPYQEPEFLPWDGRRVPLTFVGGYLGSGKTTLINELLARTDRPIAVLVNDVGEINIDAMLVRRRSGDTIELTDGCVCCSLIDGFGAAFDQLRARDTPPDHVIVELSGVAQPDRLRPWGRSAGFTLDGVVVLVDADQFLDRLGSSELRETIVAQIVAADLLVVTKLDLVDEAQLAEVRREVDRLAPTTPVVEVDRASDASMLLALGGRRPGGVADVPSPTLFDRHIVTTVPIVDPIDPTMLEHMVAELGPDVMRAKGIARLLDGTLVLIQVVGRQRGVTPLPQPEFEQPTDLVVVRLGGSE